MQRRLTRSRSAAMPCDGIGDDRYRVMDLPPLGTMRWTAWQKVAVLRAVRNGIITATEVRERYLLSEEELAGWQVDFDRNGLAGLQQKSLRQRRRHHDQQPPHPRAS